MVRVQEIQTTNQIRQYQLRAEILMRDGHYDMARILLIEARKLLRAWKRSQQ